MSDKESDEAKLEWLVEHRSNNQRASLKLYKILLARNEPVERSDGLALLGAALVAVSFSLWRAVFLCDAERLSIPRYYEDAKIFLETVIADNSINYTQDKRSREWTVLYYLNNASHRLAAISKDWPHILRDFKFDWGTTPIPRAGWERLQEALDSAITNYATALASERAKKKKT